jgi:hypothetical protein
MCFIVLQFICSDWTLSDGLVLQENSMVTLPLIQVNSMAKDGAHQAGSAGLQNSI